MTSGGVEHTVTEHGDGTWSCTCGARGPTWLVPVEDESDDEGDA